MNVLSKNYKLQNTKQMGFLTNDGRLLTYNEYKDKIEQYKEHGIKQFINLFNCHKDKNLEKEKLHWGDEIEYSLFHFDAQNKVLKLMSAADKLIDEFNKEHKRKEIEL